jgi:AcrR family transcriptional regulator
MARPRKASDETIFQAAFRVMQRCGPAEWTLEDVANEVGLTAGALVQRFGSKRELLLTVVRLFAEGVPHMYEELRRRHTSPLAALRAHADEIACMAASPEGLAHHLDYLRLDLTDADMHVHFRRQAEAARAFIRQALDDAVANGELPHGIDTVTLARQIETTIAGSLFTWATYREGTASHWMRRDLDLVLTTAAGGVPTRNKGEK